MGRTLPGMLVLPLPPSVNHYWRHVGSRTLLSQDGRAYRETVGKEVLIQWPNSALRPLPGRLKVVIRATMPDRRRRDLDNFLKSLLDALQYAGVYDDDGQIDDLHIYRATWIAQPGEVLVTLSCVATKGATP